MTYEMYRYVFLGGAIAAGVMLAVSILLFFVLQIPKVIGDLSGRTARRAIDNIRRQNEESGDKAYKSSAVNIQRGKVTDKITKSGRLQKQSDTPFGTGMATEKISTQRLTVDEPASETTVLSGDNETTVLTVENETTVLCDGYGETTLLYEPVVENYSGGVNQFTVEFEITYIHTDEVIV